MQFLKKFFHALARVCRGKPRASPMKAPYVFNLFMVECMYLYFILQPLNFLGGEAGNLLDNF